MKTWFRKHLGLIVIIGLFGLNALLWLTATPLFDQPLESRVAQWHGANILLGFTLVFFLATKNRIVVYLFNGLEKSYTYHRGLAMGSLLLIAVHGQTAFLIWAVYRDSLFLNAWDLGPLARNLFIGLIILALMAKYMKYEHWRAFHRLMIIPYLLASYHAFLLASYDLVSLTPLGLWMMAMVATGTVSSIYMIFVYRKTAFLYHGEITAVRRLNDTVTELEVSLTKPYAFETGQFAFVKIKEKPFKNVPHPFSLSGVHENGVTFTIKAIGDYTTDIQQSLVEGMHLALSKPFGHMTFDTHANTQVWIAGGIGITPFLSHLRANQTPSQHITLYYAVNTKEEAVHLALFEKLAQEHSWFTFHLIESNKTGFLTVEDLDLKAEPDVLMCGPRPMALTLSKALKKEHPHLRLTYEAFSFTGTLVEDALRLLKKPFKKRIPTG